MEYEQLKLDHERLETEAVHLKEELERRRVEDLSTRRMKRKMEELEHDMDEMIAEKVAEKETQLRNEMDLAVKQVREREGELERQLKQSEEQVRLLRASHEAAQTKLMDKSHKTDEQVVAKSAEMDLLSRELERAHARIAEQGSELTAVKAQVEAFKEGNPLQVKIDDLTKRTVEQEAEIVELMGELQQVRKVKAEMESKETKTTTTLQARLEEQRHELDRLETQLKHYGDYATIKNELDILKSHEFSRTDDTLLNNGNLQLSQSLERLLLGKNRRLQDELTQLKTSHNKEKTHSEQLNQELHKLRSDLNKRQELIDKLEHDISKIQQQQREAPKSPDHPSRPASPSSVTSSSWSHPGGDAASMLPIIKSQRDRFRQRNLELEEELARQKDVEQSLHRTISQLKDDNVKLFEKVRYMQSYSDTPTPNTLQKRQASQSQDDYGFTSSATVHSTSTTRTGRPRQVSSASAIDVDSILDDETEISSRYRPIYEESMNPFNRFHRREQTRSYRSLNPLDRALLVITRFCLANRWSRLFFAAYVLILHLLVMSTLYQSLWTHEQDLE
jgi:homeobox protein cut-like